jgi:hypothetical protein
VTAAIAASSSATVSLTGAQVAAATATTRLGVSLGFLGATAAIAAIPISVTLSYIYSEKQLGRLRLLKRVIRRL